MVSSCYFAVCAVRLQFKILWQGYTKKIRKIYGFTDGLNPSVFHRELKKIYGIVPHSLTDHNPSVFHRELKKIYGIVPLSPTDSPTALPTSNTDGYAHPETHACQTRVCLHKYQWFVSLLLHFSSPLRFYLAFGRDFIVLVVVLKGMYSFFFIFVFFYFNYDYFFWCSLFRVLFVDKILNSTHY
jgi:hypothetical protein